MQQPLFKDVDCVLLRVPDLQSALPFYEESLGHQLMWRSDVAAGLSIIGSKTELVLHTKAGPEVDMLVQDLDEAVRRFREAGGTVLNDPFDLPIGRAAVVQDPFGNVLVLLDQSKGKLVTDHDGRVTGTTGV
ncbi:VOC family protein [Rhizobium grahamii]|uniref:VOC family protein n=1 Tax=Rhizobium grahamii TaxID=1120045 RepID=UPI0005942FEC|nr:VOC family protein [Rhizobium grahamii]